MLESSYSFAKLRKDIHQKQLEEIKKRKAEDSQFTPEEKNLGLFAEELEPQVRNAVIDLTRKGYSTFSSGFYDLDSRYQTIEGLFELDPEIKTTLEQHGVEVISGPIEEFCDDTATNGKHITIIQFIPESPDLHEIEGKWDTITSLIPHNR